MKDKNMKTENIDELVEDFTKVIQFKIITTIENHYGSLAEFKAEYERAASGNNQALKRYLTNFHFERKMLTALTRSSDGKKRLSVVLSKLDNKKLVHKGKCDIKYKKSGKKFSKPSTFYIPFEELDRLFSLKDTESTPFKTDSGYYTRNQHRLIDKFIFNYTKPRKSYTKTPKFIESLEKKRHEREDTRLKAIASKSSLTDEEMAELVKDLF